MARQYLGFGNGNLGHSTSVDLNGTRASCSGTSGTTSLSATLSVTAGDIILISQTRTDGSFAWELNQVASYTPGTITTQFALENTYSNTGYYDAQVVKVNQYAGLTLTSSQSVSGWSNSNGHGGLGVVMVSGECKVDTSGKLNAKALGFLQGQYTAPITGANGNAGEGHYGVSNGTNTASASTEYGRGGGGGGTTDADGADGGGGGGHGGSGSAGSSGSGGGSHNPGAGGASYGVSTLAQLSLGSGGGQGGESSTDNKTGGAGGRGGGALIIFARHFDCSNGEIDADGGNGTGENGKGGAGGGGAGGSILIKAEKAILGTNKVHASGGSKGTNANEGGDGGNGGSGRVRIETCSYTGSASGSFSTGGHNFCSSASQIL